MSFVDLIPRPLCHPESTVRADGFQIRCNECHGDILNIVEYAQRDWDDLFYSCQLSQAFQVWTGNEGVPVTFPLITVDGIHDTKVKGQSLRRIWESVRLLRAINAPFTNDDPYEIDEEMLQFFQRYMDVVSQYRSESNGSESDQILEQLMKGMYQMIQSDQFTHPFQFYFEKLVPYVKHCIGDFKPELLKVQPNDNLAKELLYQLKLSADIRKVYGRFSIPFDIIHVMLGCYSCSSDVDAVGNYVLDWVARVCRGEYFWTRYRNNRFVLAMQHLLQTQVTFKRNYHLYHIVKQIQKGEAADSLSAGWNQYLELQTLVRDKYHVPTAKKEKILPDIIEMAMHQTFPAVLFNNHADHLGFALALGHLLMKANFKTGVLEKGSFKKAREIHKLVARFVEKVEAFDKERIPWTLETLKLFLVSNYQPEEEIKQLMQLVLTSDNDQTSPQN